MMRKVFILIAPLALLVLLELVFRLGLWEPMAKPTSHAGTSVRLKRMLLDAQLARIDFVTLGSSRPELGIDHHGVAEAARQEGFIHANLSMPGVHWMSIGILTDWLQRHHPEIRGGIIALSTQDLAWQWCLRARHRAAIPPGVRSRMDRGACAVRSKPDGNLGQSIRTVCLARRCTRFSFPSLHAPEPDPRDLADNQP